MHTQSGKKKPQEGFYLTWLVGIRSYFSLMDLCVGMKLQAGDTCSSRLRKSSAGIYPGDISSPLSSGVLVQGGMGQEEAGSSRGQGGGAEAHRETSPRALWSPPPP